ncbi:MAG: hypothetical protein JWM74_1496, partial [Myxococcaceae bacterium]|nr:hypothetical protein [Myxococcaceae bacterium]
MIHERERLASCDFDQLAKVLVALLEEVG